MSRVSNGRRNGYKSRRIPDRWLTYGPVGKPMTGTRFVAFKTPLSADYFLNQGFDDDDVFTVHSLMEVARRKDAELGLVIDLTATNRYYEANEWTDKGVQYAKIKCEGHTVQNQKDNIDHFFAAVSTFIAHNANNKKLIGVHCTHGVNRTGYLICKYLIDKDNWDPDKAIEESDGLERWRIIWIVVALVMSAGFAVVGAYFMYGCLKRRTLSSRSHRTDEVTARTDRSVGRSCDLEMELSEKIDRICKSLSQESVKSAERRQKSMTDIAANRAEKASKEAAAEKKSLSYFVKKMRSEFPELSDKTQRGSSSSGKKPRSSRNVKRKEETESREENAFRDDPLERSREESKEEAAEKSIDIKKESVVDSKTPTTFTETATATTQKSITTVLSMLPFASHDKTPRK